MIHSLRISPITKKSGFSIVCFLCKHLSISVCDNLLRGLILHFIFLFYHIQNNSSPFICTRLFEIKKYCDNYVIRSKKNKKKTIKKYWIVNYFFPFAEKRRYGGKIESTPWEWNWNEYSFGIIWENLQKLHRPTFMSIFSSSLDGAFGAEFPLDQVNFFKP